MSDINIIRKTGWFGLAGVAILFTEVVARTLPGSPPLISDAIGHSQWLATHRIWVLTWIVLDMMMYVSLMVFFAGVRHLVSKERPEYEWAGTLSLVAGAVWWAVSLVADGLEGSAVLATVGRSYDPTAVTTLRQGTVIIYNGAIAFAVTGFYMALAGYSILGSGALPKWVGRFAWVNAILCAACIPAIYVNSIDHNAFYNSAGWGPMVIANVPPLIWFLVTSILMIRYQRAGQRQAHAVVTTGL